VTTAPTIELANLVLTPAPGLQFTRHGRGSSIRYVASDVRRGKHLSLRPDAYRLLGAFDGAKSIAQIYAHQATARHPVLPPPEAAARVIATLYSSGLVTGNLPALPAPAAGPSIPEAKLVSWRRELVELGPWLPLLDRLLGWMFTRAGALVWAALAITGLWVLTDRPLSTADAFGWFAQLDAVEAFVLYLIFLVLKAVHELGHAAAYRRFAAAEGVKVASVRAGLALMFLVPFPFTNVTGAWQLSNRLRRTMVGAAGMYVESWAALIGLLVWAWAPDPVVRAAAGQVAAVSGLTTVLFNLNPLGRMDGYYIFIDLLDRPNLARQASQAALAVLARITRALPASRTGSIELPLLGYWVGSLVFRTTIYLALFWTAVAHGAVVAVAVLLIAGSLLAARPLAGSLRWLLAVADDRVATRTRLMIAVAAAAIVLLIPLPSHVALDGVVERDGLTLVYPARAAAMTATGPLAFSTAEAELDVAELEARRQIAVTAWRQALDDGHDARAFAEEAQALDVEAARSRSDVKALAAGLAGPSLAPLDLEDHRGSTVAAAGRPLAVRLPRSGFTIRAVGRETARAAIQAARGGRARALGDPATFPVTIVSVAAAASDDLPSAALGRPGGGAIAVAPGDRSGRRAAEPMVLVNAVAAGRAPALRHGQRLELRIDGAPRPLALQLYDRLALAFGAAARE